MRDWFLTKLGESSVRSVFPLPQKDLTSWMPGFRARLRGQDKEQMACMIETNHGLLLAFLLEQGWPVYPVNPRTVDRKRSASGSKTDALDASLLAKTGRADFADLHRLTPESEKIAERKAGLRVIRR